MIPIGTQSGYCQDTARILLWYQETGGENLEFNAPLPWLYYCMHMYIDMYPPPTSPTVVTSHPHLQLQEPLCYSLNKGRERAHLWHDDVHLPAQPPQCRHEVLRLPMDPHPAPVHKDFCSTGSGEVACTVTYRYRVCIAIPIPFHLVLHSNPPQCS